jgi:hypothetical protein
MKSSTKLKADANSDHVSFALTEYESITHTFAAGLNAMAVLLTLFFIFTGAGLNYVGGLFTELTKSDAHMVFGFKGADFRIVQIYTIMVVIIVLSIWSLCFVLAFREAAGKMFKRASEIEAHFPNLPNRKEHKLFAVLDRWYDSDSNFTALRTLFWSTATFYILIFASYIAIIYAASRIEIH